METEAGGAGERGRDAGQGAGGEAGRVAAAAEPGARGEAERAARAAEIGLAAQVSQERRRRSLNTTARDMLLSLAVIIGLVGVLLLLVPTPSAIPVRSLDVVAAAAANRTELGFAPADPSGRLPDGWTARTADVLTGTDGLPTWHLTYTTPSGHYIGAQQAAKATADWEARQVTDGREQGYVTVGSHDWIVRSRMDRGITSLVLREPANGTTPEVTTVVTGTGTQAEIDQFIGAVLP